MAYPTYFNPVNYNPNFYQPAYTQPAYSQSAAQGVPQAQPVNSNGLIWVQGEAGAKSYIVAPNSTVLLMDSEAQKFYIKSSDASGMPSPLRVFEYHEAQNAAVGEPKAFEADKYVTRDELDRRLAEFASKRTVKKDGEKAVKDDE